MRKSLLFSAALGFLLLPELHAETWVKVASRDLLEGASRRGMQQNIVQGTVSDKDGPIAGASVSVVGTSKSTMTDLNGHFKIEATNGQTLRVSFLGYKPRDLVVTSSQMNISLDNEDKVLEEVVVVGYGQQKKGHLTGAVSSVNVEKIMGGRPISDAGRGLQGAVPGLSVVVPSGEVGSDAVLRIRGQVGSPYGGASPLLLVDNVEVPSLQYINPNDIESITVLKDAASASIYGAKAAFGVVLVTMKKGAKTESNNVTYSNNLSWQSPFKKIELAGIEGLEYTVDAHENMRQAGPAGGFWRVDRASLEKIREWQDKYGGVIGNNDPVVYGRDWIWDGTQKFGYRLYDPVDAMVKDFPFSHQHNLGLNGRTGRTNYYFSLGYLGQQGMMKPAPHDDFKRFNPTLKVSTELSEHVSLRGAALYSEGTKRYPNSTNSTGFAADPWLYLYRWSLLFPVGVQENGKDIIDPAYTARTSKDAVKTDKYLNLNLGTTVKFTKKWDLQADYTYSTLTKDFKSSIPQLSAKTHWYGVEPWRDENGRQIYVDENGVPTDNGGMLAYQFPMTDYVLPAQTFYGQENRFSRKHTFNAFSTYNLNIAGGHEFKFMAGTNIVANDENWQSASRNGLFDSEDPFFNFADGTEKASGFRDWDSQIGFFGRFNYAFNNKYLLEANIRRDASSRFPSYMRWNWYPSVSAGWVLSEENLLKTLNPVLSFAKLRASWGSIGDQSISNGLYMREMTSGGKTTWIGSAGTPTVIIGTPRLVGAGLTWQDIEHLNVGVDLKFFKNKFGVTAEWFERNTNNMIIAGDFRPATLGTGAPLGNYGNLRTRGWELEMDFNHRFEKGLGLNLMANISDATTFITKGADFETPWEDRSLSTTYSTGRRYGDVYGFVTDRLFQAEDFVYDANGKFVQTNIIYNGTSKRTNMLAGDNPVYQTYFEDGNQTLLISPGDIKFVDVNGDGYIDAGKGTNGSPGDRVVIGNITPRYQFGFRIGADWKGFDLAVFLQGVGKRKIWGSGQLAIPGYYSKEGGMPLTFATDYWRPDRTNAFYPRAWNYNGADEGYVMRAQSRYMLNMAYLRIKNISIGYTIPKTVVERVKLSNVRFFISLENMFTFDKLRGLPIDPETISGYSMLKDSNYNLGRTGTSNPTFKSASVGVQLGF
ncbi:TonB-dependent receptor plug [Pseudopedobacter saltans DSM 12145]|uniref:TonB-dependent receptor plug n=1 Tax=Pseudopedobacter saltans (strain ATCC 51119 / DSM 12145 / JCM 21818 / CCUG 39354 / LMG 10337 / NBRC 100064 / NCIMB 13643) TaxID=762903 RepID=F0S8T0_PSESL|nr:TonB-dependent receptor [Pseudopedobacter saltans]ADY52411.1 TonB-dependent receptor plug [Pseudopedobacter saltans DSM 12145]